MATPATHVNTTTPMETSADLPMPSANTVNSPATSTPQDQTAIPASAQAAAAPNGAAGPFPLGGSVTLDPNTTPSAALNPRSCVTCRRRKVRCDKFMPCGNCRKAHIQCVFPAPGRAPRRPRVRDPDASPKQTSEREIELMKRLRKLEGIVEELSGQIEFETSRHLSSSGGTSPEAATDGGAVSGGNTMEKDRRPAASAFSGSMPGGGSPSDTARMGKPTPPGDSTAGPLLRGATGEVQRELGRLVLNERGKTRYVTNALWTKLNDELNELRAETQKLTDEGSDDSEDGSSPSGTVCHSYADHGDHHGFVLGYKSSEVDLSKLRPLPSQIPFIWQVYVENVDPLVKILHVPTMNKIIRDCRNGMNNLSPGLEALMFSIYFGSITSMEEDEVKLNFGVDKATLVNKHRFATEQALAKANFLTTSELVVVQAFTLFLVVVRRYDNTRFSWTLTGLAIRIAQSLGLHREGTHFAELKPFDVEMRRRLWWTLCMLDLRSAENHGSELTIAEEAHDTRLPLNINDSDLSPDMTDYPEEHHGVTDMSFSLVRFEICGLARKMHTAATAMSPNPRDLPVTAQEREDWLVETYDRIEEKYLRGTIDKDSNPLHWVASIIARLIMAKLSLFIYQPAILDGDGLELPQNIRDRLFLSSVEVVEYIKILDAEPRCRQWRWLFQTYSPWHGVAYLLLEMCRRPWTPSVERGWMALNTTFRDPESVLEHTRLIGHCGVWIPLRKLMLKAERHREAEIARLRNDPREAERLDIEEMNKGAPASFQHLPSSVRNSLAQERWRALVGREHFNKPKQPRWEDTNFERPGTIGARPGERQGQLQQVLQQPSHQLQQQMSKAQQEQLDRAMEQPTFNPEDFWPATLPSGFAASAEIAQTVFFGTNMLGGGSVTAPFRAQSEEAQKQSVAGAGAGTFTSTADSYHGATAAAQSTPADVAVVLDDHLPPWLWPTSTSNELYASTAGSDNAAAAKTPALGDVDVNMDEEVNINWQDWQESIRDFEMDTGMSLRPTPFMGGPL
ncbi:hypothetical protein DL770_007546 [Monosporascus sp. CRB-9-2]|nr:hypothetical protein DL770_007546 [Monosporascus sp. CRB-9-2]